MKKLLLILPLLLTGLVELSGQNVVNGKVTDKKGNPLPGVKIDIPGTDDFVLSNLDGTFEIENAKLSRKASFRYGGMQMKRKRLKPDMVVKMKKTTWWNEKPHEYRHFLGLCYNGGGDGDNTYGFMYGYAKNVGFYLKASSGFYFPAVSIGSPEELNNFWMNGKIGYTTGIRSSAGLMLRLGSPFYFNTGVGLSNRRYLRQMEDGNYLKGKFDCSSTSILLESSLMLTINKVFLNLGIFYDFDDYSTNEFEGISYYSGEILGGQISIGVIF